MKPITWSRPVVAPSLGENEVHLWRIDLAQPAGVINQLGPSLEPDEIERANRFHFARDRDHFIVGRAALRAILGRYLGQPPEALRFRTNDYGKPEVEPARLRFNLSHSGDLALCGVTARATIGVDVEQLRALPDAVSIAERFFSRHENEILQTIPAEKQIEAFFNCWTRKEAYIKALGQGLALPLPSFDVTLTPGQPAALLAVRGQPQDDVHRWALQGLIPQPGYVAAFVVEGQVRSINYWDWQPNLWS
jgi:4'-phosphopantetheinyl transferase